MGLPDDFKGALATWASGVAVVTVNDGGLLYGLTVSSFTSVSLDPPMILVCLNNSNRMPLMLEHAGRFAVSVLAADQEEASVYFASPGREPTQGFVEIEGEWSVLRQPIVAGALAHVVCEVHDVVVAGSHSVVFGEVVHADSIGGDPLVYFGRGYRRLVEHG